MRRLFAATALATTLMFAAAPAEAQISLTPFAGVTFGKDAPNEQLSTGAALAFTGAIAGVELEFGYTPDFFNEIDAFELDTDSNVTSMSANLMLGILRGPVRPYGTVGLGLLRSRIDPSNLFGGVTNNDWGVNVGAGVIVMPTDHVGVRGDLRYFRGLDDIDIDDLSISAGGFDFYRAYAGLVFEF